MNTPKGSADQPIPDSAQPLPSRETGLIKDVKSLKRRICDEATIAVGMLEAALAALWELDTDAAAAVIERDKRIDQEEVAIEEAAFRIMTLQQPVAREFRALAFILKANNDVERVGDHACSIAKSTVKLATAVTPGFNWPTSLLELGQRVPMACHALLRTLIDEDSEAAKSIVVGDKAIDRLTRELFDETVKFMGTFPNSHAAGLLIYRIGRELERVGDLMTNIAEDIVYLTTGEIIRHEKKRLRAEHGAKG
jgi:phosphate transport system protein